MPSPPESKVSNSGDGCGHEAGEYHDVWVPAVGVTVTIYTIRG